MKFSKKAHSKNMVSIKDGDYQVSWGFADLVHRSYGIVGQTSQSDDLIESAYNHISQQIKYSDVISGVDLVYNIDSLGIKENIMIHQPTDVNTFTFEYKVNGLELILNEDGDIEAINEDNEIIFLMPKPYMYDKEGNYCEDVHYKISQKNKKYTITIVADEEWLNSEDRVYPITIDPVIQTQQTANAIKSTFIASGWYNTNFNHHFELLVGRESSAYQNCRSLFQFSLPALNRGDMVIDAKFYVAQYYHSFYTSSTPNLQVNAHMLNTSWTDTSVTWNSIKGSGNENSYYDNTILDYDFIKKTDVQNAANWKVFDVTSAVKQWYNGTPNNGILLKSYNEAGSHEEVGVKGTFWPEDYNNSYNAFPFISIAYRNNKGIEGYHDYTSFSTYSAGNVYVDNYSGNLVVEHQDASTYGNLAPITVSHIYNGYMATQNPYNVGKGWKLNIHQTLKPSSQYGLTGESATTYPYVYMDQDGTEHYFIKKDNEYFDEDGLGLELKVVSGGYTITDKQDNVMTFNSSGNITSIKDVNDNTITFTYSGNKITKVTSGNGQEIILTYENELLSKITDQAGKESTYQYTDNLLTQMTYDDGSASTYEYDSNQSLQRMTSLDNTSVTFAYTTLASGKQVNQITEYGSEGGQGQTLLFDRSKHNVTMIRTSGVDGVINTSDDVRTELQFDNAGRLITTYSYTEDKELGAVTAEYTAAEANSSKSNLQQLNRITKVSSLNKSVNNLLLNHGCESTTSWSASQSVASSTFTSGATTEEALYGNKSLKLAVTASDPKGRARFCQDVTTTNIKPNTTYTASAYIKTKNIQAVSGANGSGATVLIYIEAPSMPIDQDPEAADFASEYILGTTDEQINDGWRRVSVTFTTPSDVRLVRFNCTVRGATGTAYFDALQLEEGEVANPYNMLENNSFDYGSGSAPTHWTGYGISSIANLDTNNVKNGTKALKFTSTVGKVTYYYQDVPVIGTENDTYIVSGWGYGKGITRYDERYDRQFRISIRIVFTDGTGIWKTPMRFNTAIDGWQYGARIFDLSDGTSATKTPKTIQIYMCDSYQANTLYFDNIQLIKSKVPTNNYDSEGNLISSDGSSYVYSEDNDLTSITDKRGKVTRFGYNDKHQQTSSITPSGIKTETGYDEHGNKQNQMITSSDELFSLMTETNYTDEKDFITKTIDEDGNETTYDYNKLLGLLNKITDANNNDTTYTYDDNQLLTGVTSGDISVGYVYDENQRLSMIDTATDDYTLTYDEFGNRTNVKINNNVLSTYQYQNYNGNLESILYNNGYRVSYIYDEQGNTIKEIVNDNLTNQYYYDTEGNIYKVIDYKTNQEYVYEYDGEGRLIRVAVFDITKATLENKKVYEIAWGYDVLDRVTSESIYQDGQTTIQHYTYNDNDLLSEFELDNGNTISYGYDSLERLQSKSIDLTNDLNITYSYHDSKREENYTTSKIETEVIGDTTYTYEYDNVGNIIEITIERNNQEQSIQYEYDENSQLTRENNQQTGLTTLWYYTDDGNISSKSIYPYTTTDDISNSITNIFYGYIRGTNQLQGYGNYQKFSYDSLGNPTKYMDKTMEWEGRQLVSLNQNSDNISYTYDSNGLRRTKTINNQTTIYDYYGDLLTHEKRIDSDLYYSYDESGNLAKIDYKKNGITTTYYVACNFRGDVDSIFDVQGNLVARYVYDAWGKVVSVLDGNNNQITDTNHIGNINPIRYRGYYYDVEIGFYYLQSRYYDPEVGRFISADTIEILDVKANTYDKNLYSYCDNNPIVRRDDNGYIWSYMGVKFLCYFAYHCTINLIIDINNAINGEDYSLTDFTMTVVTSAVYAGIDTITTKANGTILKACISSTITIVESLNDGESSEVAVTKGIVAGVSEGAGVVEKIKNNFTKGQTNRDKSFFDIIFVLPISFIIDKMIGWV